MSKTEQKVAAAMALHDNGMTINQIKKLLKIDSRTLFKYSPPDYEWNRHRGYKHRIGGETVTFNGCTLKNAREGTRCDKWDTCPHAYECLGYIAREKPNWQGMERVTTPAQ